MPGLPFGIGARHGSGLHRVLGKKKLYLLMLRSSSPVRSPQQRNSHRRWTGNDWGTAERLAHTLKVFRAISAPPPAAVGGNVEAQSRSVSPVRPSMVGSIAENPLENLIAQLEQKLPEEQGKTAVIVDPEKLRRSVTSWRPCWLTTTRSRCRIRCE